MELISFNSVEEYIALRPPAQQEKLQELRAIIRKAAPELEELISYQMPAYKYKGMVCYFASYDKHYGLYLMPKTLALFKDRLSAYKLSKSTIQFPLDTAFPIALIQEMITFQVQENTAREVAKRAKKTNK